MKISIELEIQPNEVALATELLATLRLLTEHVKAGPPVVKNSQQLMKAAIDKLQYQGSPETVAAELSALLSTPNLGPEEKLAAELGELLEPTAELFDKTQTVAPYMLLLPKLPEPYKTKVRDGLISKVLQHLTKKRRVDVQRAEFFAQAEAFAMLVKIEFVSVDGAVQTIERLLSKPENRAAAITMLGKTVESCQDQLSSKCSQAALTKLWKTLETVQEDFFKYDLDYITSTMGWPLSAAQQAASGAPGVPPGVAVAGATNGGPAPTTLQPMASYQGHSKTIFTLAYDTVGKQLYSGGKDPAIIGWGAAGEVASRADIPIANMCVCSMDVQPKQKLLLGCLVATENSGAQVPTIVVFDTARKMQQRGMITKPSCTLISCLRCFGTEADGFVTGETASGPGSKLTEQVCYYDLARAVGGSVTDLRPVHTYAEHADLVTCVAPFAGSAHSFVSGSRDQTIRVWDARQAKSVGMLGYSDPRDLSVRAHGDMVTCVDAGEVYCLSSSLDCTVAMWDKRMMGAGQAVFHVTVDANGVLKVAASGAPHPSVAAVATFHGLLLLDYSNVATPVPYLVPPPADGVPRNYHDIKWGTTNGMPVLFAAGEVNVDVFHLL